MTVADTTPRELYNGNGVTVTFAIPFGSEYFEDTNILVILRSSLGVETTQTLTTHYTISGSNIVMVTAPPSGSKLLIMRQMPITQSVDYSSNGSLNSFKGSSHEEALDRTVMIAQQLDEALDRSVKLPPTILESTFNPQLPNDIVLNGAGRILVVGTGADSFMPMSDSITISTITSVVSSVSAAAASAVAAAASATAASGSAVAAAASASAAALSAGSAASSVASLGLLDGQIFVGTDSNTLGAFTPTGDVLFSNLGVTSIAADVIVNADVKSNAAIVYSKLNLATSVVNADIGTGAGIVYTKLALGSSIVAADINGAAAIEYSKLNLATSIVNADVRTNAGIVYSKLSLGSSIVAADVSGAAAIEYSKLNLATSVVNADVRTNAGIVYSKLSLGSSIVAADVAGAAGIERSKLGTGAANHVWINDASGNYSSVAPSTSGNVLTSTGSTWASSAAAAGGTVATQASMETGTSVTDIVTPGRFKYSKAAAKAWVYFDAASTGSPTIGDSFGVSSVGDTAPGQYAVNFSIPFSTTSFSWAGVAKDNGVANMICAEESRSSATLSFYSLLVTTQTATDSVSVNTIFFGDV